MHYYIETLMRIVNSKKCHLAKPVKVTFLFLKKCVLLFQLKTWSKIVTVP